MKKTFREYHLFKALNSCDFKTTPLDLHLSQYFRKVRAIGSKDRKIIAENIYQMIRWLGLIDHFCKESHDWEERYKIFQTLNLSKASSDPLLPLHIRASAPKNLFQLLLDHFGEQKALELCFASNTKAPTTIRVNVLKTNRHSLFLKWQEKFQVSLAKTSVWGIHFEDKIHFPTMEEFKEGLFEVQDEGSQLISNLVEPKPGDQVLDFCAGSGGKTLAFAHKLQGKGQIYLHDVRKIALTRAKRRLKRAGIENGQILPHNAPHKERLKKKFDWVLVDVPCSGTGTFRRNPDLKWKFSEEMLQRLVREQRDIFQEALSFLHPKGKIVYATCSLLPQENEEQIFYFQEAFGLDLVEKLFRTHPTEGGMDGFFAAVLTQRSGVED